MNFIKKKLLELNCYFMFLICFDLKVQIIKYDITFITVVSGVVKIDTYLGGGFIIYQFILTNNERTEYYES